MQQLMVRDFEINKTIRSPNPICYRKAPGHKIVVRTGAFKMKNTLKNSKSWFALIATLSCVMLVTNVYAANFLFFWSASADPSVTAYGIYQRTNDSSYEMIDKVNIQDLDNPSNPSYLITGLMDGNTYWFAATSITSSGNESNLSNQTCITVNGQIIECTDNNENGTTVFISCFITAAGR